MDRSSEQAYFGGTTEKFLASPRSSYDSIESLVNKMTTTNNRESEDVTPINSSRQSRQAKWEEIILFFLSAAGCTLGWTAVLSNLVYYTNALGVESYVILNLCIYAPLFPITIAQSLFDADFDRKFTSITSFWVRGSLGFGVTLISTVILALGSPENDTLWSVSLLSLSLGTSSGILHGALKQMASFVYPGCGRLAASVTAGLQASAVLVLFVTLGTGGSTDPDNCRLHYFYGIISILVALCWLGFQRLMTHSRDVYRSMVRRDSFIQLSSLGGSSMALEDEEAVASYHDADDLLTPTSSRSQSSDDGDTQASAEQLLPSHSTNEAAEPHCSSTGPGNDNNNQQPFWTLSPAMKQVILQSWPLCLAIFLTVASSMAVASWFNRVPSTSKHHPEMLPQVLFYTRLFADLLARPSTLLLPTNNDPESPPERRTLWYLLGLVGVRLFFVPYFFLYTTSSWFPRSDCLMTLGVFAFAFSSGFITTWVYQLAPKYCKAIPVTSSEQESLLQQGAPQQQQSTAGDALLLLQQTNLLNVCFSASVLLGLIGSLSLSGMDMPDSASV